MTIANTGFHSVEIRGFGFKHKTKDYDYLRLYKEERNIPSTQKIVISPRDSLETIIDLNDLKAKLNTKKIGKFRAYSIDVYGNYSLIKAKDVKKFIELYFKQIEFIEKVRKMPAEKQQKMLAKENMYTERRNKILNHTIEDTFEKANIDGEKQEELKFDTPKEEKPVFEDIKVNSEVVEEKIVEEPQIEESIETEEVEDYTAKNEDFFFNDVTSLEEVEEETKDEEEEK